MRRVGVSRKVLAAVLIGIIIGFTGGVVFAQITGVAIKVPWQVTIAIAPSDLKVHDVSFTYHAPSNTYTNAKVKVRNHNTMAAVSGALYVFLLDSANNIIASGSKTETVDAGATVTVTVELTWVPGKTVRDVASGRVSVEQTT